MHRPDNMRVNRSVACEMWCSDRNYFDGEVCYLSPWKVLQCHLEGILQVLLSLTIDPLI